MELQHQLHPRHWSTWRHSGKESPRQDPQKRTKQGPLKGGQQEMRETDAALPQDAHKGRDEPALRICCPHLLLPLELRCWNLSSQTWTGEGTMVSRRQEVPLQPFPDQVLCRGHWIPHSHKDPFPAGLLPVPAEAESMLPNSCFTWHDQHPLV